jgi:hypothetical protein
MSRLFAIPDTHGRIDLLEGLFQKLCREEGLDLQKDKLIFLGDMIDRGRDSASVLRYIRDLTLAHPKTVIALAGNHEYLMLDAIYQPDSSVFELWMWNGGDDTLASFGSREIPESVLNWVASLPLSHEEPGFFFSHAPVPKETRRLPANRGKPFTREELTWTYDRFEADVAREFENGVIGVCGHIHRLRDNIKHPRFYEHYYFLDAGCGCSATAPLVAVEVRTRKVIFAYPIEAQATRSSDVRGV